MYGGRAGCRFVSDQKNCGGQYFSSSVILVLYHKPKVTRMLRMQAKITLENSCVEKLDKAMSELSDAQQPLAWDP